MLVLMLLVLQIPFRLLLVQSYSLCINVIDNFMLSESTLKFMFSVFMSFGRYSLKLSSYCSSQRHLRTNNRLTVNESRM